MTGMRGNVFDIKESYAEPTDSLNVATCIGDIEAKKYTKRYERSIKKLDVAGIMDSMEEEKYTKLLRDGPENEDIIEAKVLSHHSTSVTFFLIPKYWKTYIDVYFQENLCSLCSVRRDIPCDDNLTSKDYYRIRKPITENFGKKWGQLARAERLKFWRHAGIVRNDYD